MPPPGLVPQRFEAFGPTHYSLLAVFALGAVAIVWLGRRQRGTDRARAFSRGLAILIPCFTVPSQVFQLTPGAFDLATSLPLQLCDVAWVTAVWALWSHRRLPAALTYFWGLTLTSQAILTPSLAEVFPDPRFFAFWCMHFLIVWSALYLTLGLGIGPTWRDYRVTVAITVVWALVIYPLNLVLDVNYGYLVSKPASASLFDLLGPWPVYVLAALAVLAALWALMTWPWTRSGRSATAGTSAG